jgi:hypothetical protein
VELAAQSVDLSSQGRHFAGILGWSAGLNQARQRHRRK